MTNQEAVRGRPNPWRVRGLLPLVAPMLAIVGCPAPATPPDAAMLPDAAVTVDASTSPDAARAPDAAMAIDAATVPDAAMDDAFVPPDATFDGGPDAWTRPAPTFVADELAAIGTLSPLAALPADTTNAFADDPDAAALGHALFFDARYSGPLVAASDLGAVGDRGRVSCASCHSSPVMSDDRSVPDNVSLGTNFHTRNAPAIVNSAFYEWTNWGGRFSRPWELPPAVAESGLTMNSTRLEIAHHLFTNYRAEYEAVFGAMEPAIGSDLVRFPAAGKPSTTPGPWESMTAADQTIVNRIFVNFGKAIQAYMRQVISRESDFDRFVAGDATALSVDAQWGLRVFLGSGNCVTCHSGPHMSDGEFHNLGVPQIGEHVPMSDDGRFTSIPPLLTSGLNAAGVFSDDRPAGAALIAGLTNPPPESTRGQFRTPTLRDLEHSGPYMHAGQMATLEEVVDFYVDGGATPVSGTLDADIAPLTLSDEERSDLLAFLRALSTDPVPEALRTAP